MHRTTGLSSDLSPRILGGAVMMFALGTMLAGCTSPHHAVKKVPPPPASRLVVTASGGCPKVISTDVYSTAGQAATVLVPSHPTGGLVCSYGPVASHGSHLVGSARISAATARHLVAMLDKLPDFKGAVACPMDTGARDVLAFTYKHGGVADVEVGLSGCRVATNGQAARWASARLLDTLASIVAKRP